MNGNIEMGIFIFQQCQGHCQEWWQVVNQLFICGFAHVGATFTCIPAILKQVLALPLTVHRLAFFLIFAILVDLRAFFRDMSRKRLPCAIRLSELIRINLLILQLMVRESSIYLDAVICRKLEIVLYQILFTYYFEWNTLWHFVD